MGTESSKMVVKHRQYNMVNINIPYAQLQMIKVLQSNFDYEVKGTIHLDDNRNFSCFLVRTDSSELYSYGDSKWKISFHTHPDKTAIKYGLRYFSPPSIDDVLEIYEHSIAYAPTSLSGGLGEISIIFANEGIYVLQVNRERFRTYNKSDMPIELLEECLKGTFTEFMVDKVKRSIFSNNKSPHPDDIANPKVDLAAYQSILRGVAADVTEEFGFNMSYSSWSELEEAGGLNLLAYDYFLTELIVNGY